MSIDFCQLNFVYYQQTEMKWKIKMTCTNDLIDYPGFVNIDIDNILEEIENHKQESQPDDKDLSGAINRPLLPVNKPSWSGRLERQSIQTEQDLSGYQCGR